MPKTKKTKKTANKTKSTSKKGKWDKLKKSLKERAGSGGLFYKFTQDRTAIRLIPFEHGGKDLVFCVQYSHYLPAVNKYARCHYPEQCPQCDEDEERNTDTMKEQFLVNAIVRDLDGQDQLRVVRCPVSVYNACVRMIHEKPEKVLEDKGGRDLKVTRIKKGDRISYDVSVDYDDSRWGVDVEPVDLVERGFGFVIDDDR